MSRLRTGPAIALVLAILAAGLASLGAGAAETALPPPLARLSFGMALDDARSALPDAQYLEDGLDFGALKGLLVLQAVPTLGSSFRIYLQFDGDTRLRQVLLERRHAAATRKSARTVQDALLQRYGKPAEICMPVHATPAAGRITWRTEDWSLHLVGIDDLGLGMLTEDADRSDALENKPIARSRDERSRDRQQRSLPRRILIRIHGTGDTQLLPPPCGAG
ncbi:hypothetical protein [Nisaea sediminum]|uniref:hypothetical protein n=1 Tax=Nisaea sediminum TaxID=2775867 RepID=UPI001865E4C4|nr:hypothetical protein [Nisaea sediminum]